MSTTELTEDNIQKGEKSDLSIEMLQANTVHCITSEIKKTLVETGTKTIPW